VNRREIFWESPWGLLVAMLLIMLFTYFFVAGHGVDPVRVLNIPTPTPDWPTPQIGLVVP